MPVRAGTITEKIFLLGEKGSGVQTKGRVQDFHQLRDKHLKDHTLFEDDTFPADESSLFFKPKNSKLVWRRPKEICQNPQLFVEGHSRFDAVQGELYDCWLVATISNLALHENILSFVIPKGQDFGDKYAGIFHFRIWQYGKWVDVVIDDRLPYSKTTSKLYYLRSRKKNEFWGSLLEKAYAKLNGSYEALCVGYANDAMQDFTGGLTEVFRFKTAGSPGLSNTLLRAQNRSSLMSCSMRIAHKKGLIANHAYSITGTRYVKMKDSEEEVFLIRLRNPCGTLEWSGDWYDRSKKWLNVADSEKKALDLVVDTDGEFWMSFEDFERQYLRVEICNLGPQPLTDDVDHVKCADRRNWKTSFFEGQWKKGVTAGGNKDYRETFHHNPQYRVTLHHPDGDDGMCTLIVGLLQKFRRQQKHLGIKNLFIAIEIYRIENLDSVSTPLGPDFFSHNAPIMPNVNHCGMREFTVSIRVTPGTYCVIPCTHDPDQEGAYLLRVFTEEEHVLEEHDVELAYNKESVKTELQSSPEGICQDKTAYALFHQYARETGGIGWRNLKIILDKVLKSETNGRGFAKDLCRSMVAMLDSDRSGKLEFEEFESLWLDVQIWKNAFKLHDEDHSGTMNPFELRSALNSAGYGVNAKMLNLILHRYGNKNGELEFEDFIMGAVRLKTMISIFNEKDPTKNNSATFSLEQWIGNALYS